MCEYVRQTVDAIEDSHKHIRIRKLRESIKCHTIRFRQMCEKQEHKRKTVHEYLDMHRFIRERRKFVKAIVILEKDQYVYLQIHVKANARRFSISSGKAHSSDAFLSGKRNFETTFFNFVYHKPIEYLNSDAIEVSDVQALKQNLYHSYLSHIRIVEV